jgi:hypothetical protein
MRRKTLGEFHGQPPSVKEESTGLASSRSGGMMIGRSVIEVNCAIGGNLIAWFHSAWAIVTSRGQRLTSPRPADLEPVSEIELEVHDELSEDHQDR